MDTRKVLVIAFVAALLSALLGYYVLYVRAQEVSVQGTQAGETFSCQVKRVEKMVNTTEGYHYFMKKLHKRLARFVEVSPDYVNTVKTVLESNEETANLLSQGFEVIKVKPLIKAYVAGNGDVYLRATKAIVELAKNGSKYVYLVDIAEGSVTLLKAMEETCRCVCPCSQATG